MYEMNSFVDVLKENEQLCRCYPIEEAFVPCIVPQCVQTIVKICCKRWASLQLFLLQIGVLQFSQTKVRLVYG
jgi:hypothetical protein